MKTWPSHYKICVDRKRCVGYERHLPQKDEQIFGFSFNHSCTEMGKRVSQEAKTKAEKMNSKIKIKTTKFGMCFICITPQIVYSTHQKILL